MLWGGARRWGGTAAGPAAKPPKRAEPVCPPERRAACGRIWRGDGVLDRGTNFPQFRIRGCFFPGKPL